MPAPALALVGLGRWGRNYLRTVRETGLFRLVAVCDTDPLIEPHPGCPCFRSIEEMLGQPGVDAVVIATPNSTHAGLARQCLEAGLDVLVEKPMARSSAEATALVELAESRGRVLAAAFPSLYLAGYERVRDRIRTGLPSTGARLEALRTSAGSTEPDTDVLWDLAPHDLAVAISLFGHPMAIGLERCGTRAEYRIGFAGGVTLRGVVEWRTGDHERWLRIHGNSSRCEIREDDVTDPADRPLARMLADFKAACAQRGELRCTARLGLEVVGCLESLETVEPALLAADECRT
jgi:predicted dehydrogenase